MCPNHHRVVLTAGDVRTPDGKLLGVCDGCARECAAAIRDVEQGVARANFWAERTLERYA